MAYFLKKNIKNGKTYLSIVNGFYDSAKKCAAHETYASYGCVEKIKQSGIEDPISYYQKVVDELNEKRKNEKVQKISEVAPIKYLGHFLVNAILEKLKLRDIVKLLSLQCNYQFDLYDVLSSLIFSRILKPCSKYKTFTDVIPYLDTKYNFSYDQLLSGLAYFGENYNKLVEICTELVKVKYQVKTKHAYFDCTNFYFEIDREDDFRKKGPSKENRRLPLLGMGLLLDSNQVPIGMKLFPGNESEKPKIREIINELKEKNEIKNKIIQVADKGLNCARNIYEARANGDGYIFSKSCKMLPDTERNWIFSDLDYKEIKDSEGNVLYKVKHCIDDYTYFFENENKQKISFTLKEKRIVTFNPSLAKKQLFEIEKLEIKAKELCLSQAQKEEYGECAKYVNFKGNDGSKATPVINMDKINQDKKLCGYNMIVTSELRMSAKEIYDTYHNLWRIEDTFRMMKSELDARPAFMKKEETLHGHFLVCYIAVLLVRLLQIYEFNDEISYQGLFEFMRSFTVTKYGDKNINLARKTAVLEEIEKRTKLPLNHAILTETKTNKIMNFRFKNKNSH